jgi:hypothetical protein
VARKKRYRFFIFFSLLVPVQLAFFCAFFRKKRHAKGLLFDAPEPKRCMESESTLRFHTLSAFSVHFGSVFGKVFARFFASFFISSGVVFAHKKVRQISHFFWASGPRAPRFCLCIFRLCSAVSVPSAPSRPVCLVRPGSVFSAPSVSSVSYICLPCVPGSVSSAPWVRLLCRAAPRAARRR